MEKAVAILTIYRAAEMTPQGRREVAHWLKEQRHFLLRHSDQLAGRYRARYIVTVPEVEEKTVA